MVDVTKEAHGHGPDVPLPVLSQLGPVEAVDGPPVLESHGLAEPVVQLKECQNLRTDQLVSVCVDKQVVWLNP